MASDQTIGPFAYEGDVIVTCYGDAFRLQAGSETTSLAELDQAVVPCGPAVSITCDVAGSIQLIWVPPYAPVKQL
jgi:hypothetical protein